MKPPIPYLDIPTTEEARVLSELSELSALHGHPGWRRIVAFMDELVAEAEQTEENNLSSDAQLAWNLKWRKLQRKRMRDALVLHVESAAEQRKDMVMQLSGEEPQEE